MIVLLTLVPWLPLAVLWCGELPLRRCRPSVSLLWSFSFWYKFLIGTVPITARCFWIRTTIFRRLKKSFDGHVRLNNVTTSGASKNPITFLNHGRSQPFSTFDVWSTVWHKIGSTAWIRTKLIGLTDQDRHQPDGWINQINLSTLSQNSSIVNRLIASNVIPLWISSSNAFWTVRTGFSLGISGSLSSVIVGFPHAPYPYIIGWPSRNRTDESTVNSRVVLPTSLQANNCQLTESNRLQV